jgi:hypothetical protein
MPLLLYIFTKSGRAGLVYSFLSNNHFLHKQRGSTFYFNGLYLPEFLILLKPSWYINNGRNFRPTTETAPCGHIKWGCGGLGLAVNGDLLGHRSHYLHVSLRRIVLAPLFKGYNIDFDILCLEWHYNPVHTASVS